MTEDEIQYLRDVAALNTGGCTEWSCMYHGEINRARHELRKLDAA